MHRLSPLIAAASACVLSACAANNLSSTNLEERLTQPDSLPGNYLALTGGGCLGTCPDYTLIVFDDGSVIFNGQSHTAYRGIYRTKLRASAYRKLRQQVADTGLYTRPAPKDCMTDSAAYRVIEKRASEPIREGFIDSGCTDDAAFGVIVEAFMRATGVEALVSRRRWR